MNMDGEVWGEVGAVHEVVALEAAALARWCRGDPSGFLEVVDEDVSYFDPFLSARLDGKAALRAYYESLRGEISAVSWEIIEPGVIEIEDVVVLTFRFRSKGDGGGSTSWNATEVWRRRAGAWKIIHTHWSFSNARGAKGTA